MVDVPPVSNIDNIYICESASLSCHLHVERSTNPSSTGGATPKSSVRQIAGSSRRLLAQTSSPVPPPPSLQPTPESPSPAPLAPNTPTTNPTEQKPPLPVSGVVELQAEQQEYNNTAQVITASGKVVMRFRSALLKADRLEVSLQTKKAVATGNVSLKRGQQILTGERFDYDFGNDKGSITTAGGEIFQPSIAKDLNLPRVAAASGEFTDPPFAEKLQQDQPVRRLTGIGSSTLTIGSDREIEFQPALKPSGTVTRLRYKANQLEFDGKALSGKEVRLTNDPFSPPELEVRADQISLESVSAEDNQVTAANPRVTIDQGFSLPLVVSQLSLNQFGRDTNPFGVGFDNDDRGGLYLERSFYPILQKNLRLTVLPQYYLQRAISQNQYLSLDSFGVKTNLDAILAPGSTLKGSMDVTSLEPSRIGNTLRSRLAFNQELDLLSGKHNFEISGAYRDRVSNGTLGFQDVQSSLGAKITSPTIDLGGTGINLKYFAGADIFNANTDRTDLAGSDGRINLSRLQGGASLNKSFRLWEGVGPPVNERSTYNYSPVPVVPYLQLNTGVEAKVNTYSNGDSQSLYGFNASLQGQFGHFTAPFLDYTGFNIGYAQNFLNGSSPYLFDRFLDTRVVTAGINQQLFGPFKAGIQTSINIDNGQSLGTDYYLEYSRRTFGILVRYNPVLQLGSIGFKLNDLNWQGQADPF
jgi:lipopolysaccharide export system protein LptA